MAKLLERWVAKLSGRWVAKLEEDGWLSCRERGVAKLSWRESGSAPLLATATLWV